MLTKKKLYFIKNILINKKFKMKQINIWAILVTSVAIMLFGMIWYGFVFFDIWATGWGLVVNPAPPNLFSLIYNFLAGLIYVSAFSFLLLKLNALNLKGAIGYGLLISLTFIIPGVISNAWFLGVSVTATAVDSAFLLIRGLIISLIIGAWTKKPRITH